MNFLSKKNNKITANVKLFLVRVQIQANQSSAWKRANIIFIISNLVLFLMVMGIVGRVYRNVISYPVTNVDISTTIRDAIEGRGKERLLLSGGFYGTLGGNHIKDQGEYWVCHYRNAS